MCVCSYCELGFPVSIAIHVAQRPNTTTATTTNKLTYTALQSLKTKLGCGR